MASNISGDTPTGASTPTDRSRRGGAQPSQVRNVSLRARVDPSVSADTATYNSTSSVPDIESWAKKFGENGLKLIKNTIQHKINEKQLQDLQNQEEEEKGEEKNIIRQFLGGNKRLKRIKQRICRTEGHISMSSETQRLTDSQLSEVKDAIKSGRVRCENLSLIFINIIKNNEI